MKDMCSSYQPVSDCPPPPPFSPHRRVICLCAQFEAVLQHGLKKSRGLALTAAALKQAAGFSSKTEAGRMKLCCWPSEMRPGVGKRDDSLNLASRQEMRELTFDWCEGGGVLKRFRCLHTLKFLCYSK